ncbi:methyl-accepting chemotaxis protein [Saccharibacillus brassicae]|nr:methyl-accepting chemotaxis protein [Saccharibacillus brassicae]
MQENKESIGRAGAPAEQRSGLGDDLGAVPAAPAAGGEERRPVEEAADHSPQQTTAAADTPVEQTAVQEQAQPVPAAFAKAAKPAKALPAAITAPVERQAKAEPAARSKVQPSVPSRPAEPRAAVSSPRAEPAAAAAAPRRESRPALPAAKPAAELRRLPVPASPKSVSAISPAAIPSAAASAPALPTPAASTSAAPVPALPTPAVAAEPELKLADYSRPAPIIGPELTCFEALQVFKREPGAPCVVVCSPDGRPTLLLMRDAFYRKLTGRFAPELFYDRPVAQAAGIEPLTADCGTPPAELIDIALTRGDESFADCVVLTREERCEGVLTVRDLIRMSRDLQERSARERQEQIAGSRFVLDGVSGSLSEIHAAAGGALSEAARMNRRTEEGRRALSEAGQAFAEASEAIAGQRGAIGDMLDCAREIAQATGSIRGIAGTSSLLALNASIEAARAGEAGRGFAVVAGEVRALAESTRRLSDEIGSLLERMNALSLGAASGMEEAETRIRGAAGRMGAADDEFREVSASARGSEEGGRFTFGLTESALREVGAVRQTLESSLESR